MQEGAVLLRQVSALTLEASQGRMRQGRLLRVMHEWAAQDKAALKVADRRPDRPRMPFTPLWAVCPILVLERLLICCVVLALRHCVVIIAMTCEGWHLRKGTAHRLAYLRTRSSKATASMTLTGILRRTTLSAGRVLAAYMCVNFMTQLIRKRQLFKCSLSGFQPRHAVWRSL